MKKARENGKRSSPPPRPRHEKRPCVAALAVPHHCRKRGPFCSSSCITHFQAAVLQQRGNRAHGKLLPPSSSKKRCSLAAALPRIQHIGLPHKVALEFFKLLNQLTLPAAPVARPPQAPLHHRQLLARQLAQHPRLRPAAACRICPVAAGGALRLTLRGRPRGLGGQQK